MRPVLALAFLAVSLGVWAGGTAFTCRYEELVEEANGRLRLTLHTVENPDVRVSFVPNRRLVLHIEYSSHDPLPSGHPPISRKDFDAAIARIRADLANGTETRLGVMGAALRPIKDRPGHYRVFGLRLEDEQDPDKPGAPPVVYAY
jgi:hypothetical protein